MWTITITHPDRTVTTASAVTREDARRWARRFSGPADTITYRRPPVSLVKRYTVAQLVTLASADGGDAPGSRYGNRVASFAPFAVAAHLVMCHANGSDDTVAELDAMLGLVVNDSPDPAELIIGGWDVLPRGLRADLGGLRHVRGLVSA